MLVIGFLSLAWLATTAALAADGEGKLPVQYRDKLFAVTFASETDIWVVGDFGLMLHSSDGGRSWSVQESGVIEDLLAVQFLDPMRGFAVGLFATLLETSDGGTSWSLVGLVEGSVGDRGGTGNPPQCGLSKRRRSRSTRLLRQQDHSRHRQLHRTRDKGSDRHIRRDLHPDPERVEAIVNPTKGFEAPLLRFLGNLGEGRRPAVVLLGTAALTSVAAVLTSGITIGDAHPGTPILWPDSEYNQAIAAINRSYPGSDQLFVIVDGESPDTIKRPEVLHRLNEFQRFMEESPDVGATVSLADALDFGEGMAGSTKDWIDRALTPWKDEGWSYETLKEGYRSFPEAERPPYEGGKFQTESGRFIFPTSQPAGPEPVAGFPLRLISRATRQGTNSMLVNIEPTGLPVVKVNPRTAARFGVDPTKARLRSADGSVDVALELDPKQRDDVVVCRKGGWWKSGHFMSPLLRNTFTPEGGVAYNETVVILEPPSD